MKSSSICRLLLVAVLACTPLLLTSGSVQAQGDVLFQDPFEDNANGWEVVGDPDAVSVEVGDGIMTLATTREGYAGWATPDVTLPDNITVEVKAKVIRPARSGNWNFGILLRSETRTSNTSFYHFGVAGNGTYEFSVRPQNPKTYADVIERGKIPGFRASSQFTLQVTAQDNTFTFTVNGNQVGQWEDDSLSDPATEKYMGLMVGTYSGVDRNEVQFTDLAVFTGEAGSGGGGGGSSDVLLSDTFRNNDNNWNVGKSTDSNVAVRGGQLRIDISKENLIRWTFPEQKFPADIDVTVKMQMITDSAGTAWGYGIGLRGYESTLPDGKATKDFILCEVRGNGSMYVTTQNGGNVIETLLTKRMRDFDPSGENEMRFVARGSSFECYMNGTLVASVEDSTLEEQDEYLVLLEAGTFKGESDLSAVFTDFVVAPAE
jgi:hypothetical protein